MVIDQIKVININIEKGFTYVSIKEEVQVLNRLVIKLKKLVDGLDHVKLMNYCRCTFLDADQVLAIADSYKCKREVPKFSSNFFKNV